MATILLIDGNPEQRKAVSGLLQYRTPHSVVEADGLLTGARAVVSQRPDLIMINALLFMKDDYAFCRVLRQDGRTRSIPVAVHTASPLGELAERRIQAQGATGIVEMPASAGELVHHIEGAFEAARQTRQTSRGVRPVQWPTGSQASAQADESGTDRPVRPVDWRSIASNRANQTPGPAAARPEGTGEPRQPRHKDRGTGSEKGRGGFQSSQFEAVDPSQAKGRGEGGEGGAFRQSEFPTIDPEKAKKRPRGGR